MSQAISAKTPAPEQGGHPPAWYRPIFSPEHGVYIVLLGSFLTGAAAAQGWTWMTSLALVCALAGFQAEHPLVLQVKQRKSWKPRFLFWAGLYAAIAVVNGGYLLVHTANRLTLLWIGATALSALAIDVWSVFQREQRSILNEFITFAAVCLSAPLAYWATSGSLSVPVMGLWLLNTLYFAGAIFTLKLRKPWKGDWLYSLLADHANTPLLVAALYHAIATLVILGLWFVGWLAPLTAAGFVLGLCKFGLIVWQANWYRTTRIGSIALLETGFALIFTSYVALTLLPAHLA